MNVSFDFYEYAGIIVPGAVLAFGAMWLSPELKAQLGPEGFTFGELGLFVVLSYALGQLVQAVGTGLAKLFWWPLGGLPSKRILDGEALTEQQHARLTARLRELEIASEAASKEEAFAAVREMYARVAASGNAKRVDKFNGIYGMMRGLAASLIMLAVAYGYVRGGEMSGVMIMLAMAAVAIRRMHGFGWHYGRELAVVFLATQTNADKA
ncbi:MAG: hypothetical protein HKN21_01655 [Candidatus Eisenbacteria bacterium]|uniref:Uncharacterized protein n=1 Tax=Eiseniibacteriota bacterium TaxID=2212470 RepID=A0A7Y2EC49_UNCEI|nr:hypothetical protein [Candidatus Eisenbacteria bacterium]